MAEGARNPYPGPRPFNPEEYSIFAGRDYEISELSSLIIAHQVVLLHAESGAGKTSLLNAGLGFGLPRLGSDAGPSLMRKGLQLLPVARVGIPVPQSVPVGEVTNVYAFSAVGDLLPEVADDDVWLRRSTLAEALDRIPRKRDAAGDWALRVAAFDQFEEMFSSYPQRWENRLEFSRQVAEALRKDSSLRVLFVLRDDYLAAFGNLVEPLPEGARTRYHLERLREPAALLAIKQPLRGTPWTFADGVAESLVKDLSTITAEDASGTLVSVPGEFVEPVQLQVVCYNLCENLPPTATEITSVHVEKFGKPSDALQLFYERAIGLASGTSGATEGRLRSWFEKQLITATGTRGLVFRGRDESGGIPNRVVDVLEAEHLIRGESRSGSRFYELAHDRFLGPIHTSNKKWRERQLSKLLSLRLDIEQSLSVRDFERASAYSNESLSVSQELGDASGVALALAYRGEIFAGRGQNEDAAHSYLEALRHTEETADTELTRWLLLALSALRSRQQRFEEAIDFASRLVSLAPNDPRGYRRRAAACWYSGRLEDARRDYTKCIELSPRTAGIYNDRGQVLAEMGEYQAAIEDLDRSIELNTDDPVLQAYSRNGRGLAYTGLKKYDRALEDFRVSLELRPENAWAYYNRGLTYEEMGRQSEALKDFRTALGKSDPPLNPPKLAIANDRVRHAEKRAG